MHATAVKALVGIALVAGAVIGFQWYVGGVRAQADKAGYERAQGEYAKAAFQASEHFRQEEARREASLNGVINDTRKELEGARAAAAGAVAAGTRLREELAAARRRACRPNPDSTGGGASASAAEGVLADVQRRLDEHAEAVARHADEARAAGRACERAYDALTPR